MIEAKGLPPYIRSKDSYARRCWGQVVALAPLVIAGCVTGHAQILRVLLLSLVSAVAFEYLGAKFFKTRENLRNGEVVLNAVLFALLIPARCPSELVILGMFLGVIAGKIFWGGTGAYSLHPVLLARVALQTFFPKEIGAPGLFSGAGDPWTLGAVALGGLILLKQKQGYWEVPFLFIAVCFFCEMAGAGREVSNVFLSGVLFTAFFLLADPVPMPVTRRGTSLFVLGAALLSCGISRNGFSIAAAAVAILLMDLVVPWIDLGLRSPKHACAGRAGSR